MNSIQIYTSLIDEYIAYKQAQGYKMTGIKDRLYRFERFAISSGESEIGISKRLMDLWIQPFPMETECNRYQRISIVRQFSSFLQLMGYKSYIPKLPKFNSTYVPYIFTQNEMERIFYETDRLRVSKNYPRSFKNTMPVLIRVLYSTGIRIGEAIKLKHSDVNLIDGYLHLKGCKNGCERVVPLSTSTISVCKDYLAYKLRIGVDINPDSFFFTSDKGETGTIATIYQLFRQILYRAKIHHSGKGKGPRLHDLRHTFCVNSLASLAQRGYDLYYSLPILMTYMGHRSIDATNKYVMLTEELYPGLISKIDETYDSLFPTLTPKNDNYEDD